MSGRVRRILALQRLASDQNGTPEGRAALARSHALRAALTADEATILAGLENLEAFPPPAYVVAWAIGAALDPRLRVTLTDGDGVTVDPTSADPATVAAWATAMTRAVRFGESVQGAGTLRGALSVVGASLQRVAAGVDPNPDENGDIADPPGSGDGEGPDPGPDTDPGAPWTPGDDTGADSAMIAACAAHPDGWVTICRWILTGEGWPGVDLASLPVLTD